MVGKLLLRGMLAGIAAGLLTFAFAKVAGEPQVDQAVAFEEKAAAARGEAPEPELVSRATQANIGLLTGVVAYGAAFGGLFALTFAYAYGRVGKLGARALSAWLAAAAFVALVIVPNLKYPANPPSVGDPETERLQAIRALGLPPDIGRNVHQNRLLRLAREGGQTAVYQLEEYETDRRHATLVAILLDTAATLTDEILNLHHRLIGSFFTKAKHKYEKRFAAEGKAVNDKVRLYAKVGSRPPVAARTRSLKARS